MRWDALEDANEDGQYHPEAAPPYLQTNVTDQRRTLTTTEARITFIFKMGKDKDSRNQKLGSLAWFLARLRSKFSWMSLPGTWRTKKQFVNLCWVFQRTKHTWHFCSQFYTVYIKGLIFSGNQSTYMDHCAAFWFPYNVAYVRFFNYLVKILQYWTILWNSTVSSYFYQKSRHFICTEGCQPKALCLRWG